MALHLRPLPIKGGSLSYAPTNELGVVFLFANLAPRLGFRIVRIQSQFPDCIAWRRRGHDDERVRIEFEFRSSNFHAHRHRARGCDAIVCWRHDWPDVPIHLEVIELSRQFGLHRKVWIQQALSSQWRYLDSSKKLEWALSKNATPGDLLLMYRCAPRSCITDLFEFSGKGLEPGKASWREGKCYGGEIARVCALASPIFLTDLRNHDILRTASFVRRNMQGVSLGATEYWPHLFAMIRERNPAAKRVLERFSPERL